MQCPECGSTHIWKKGSKQGKQNYICVNCRRQFIDSYDALHPYSEAVKQHCLKLQVNGVEFHAIGRVTEVHHITVIFRRRPFNSGAVAALRRDRILASLTRFAAIAY